MLKPKKSYQEKTMIVEIFILGGKQKGQFRRCDYGSFQFVVDLESEMEGKSCLKCQKPVEQGIKE